MQDWIMTYDYVAAGLMLVVLVWYLTEKKIPLKSHAVFLSMILLVFSSTCLEILTTQLVLHGVRNRYVIWGLLSIQKFIFNLIPIRFVYYVLILAHVDFRRHRMVSWSFLFAVAVNFAVFIGNPITKWAFYTEGGVKYTAFGSYLVYAIDFIMVDIGIVCILLYAKRFTFLRPFTMFFNLLVCIGAAILEIAYQIPLVHLAISLLCLAVYYYLQNSGTRVDYATKQFNRSFLGEYLESCFAKNISFSAISVAMDDFKFINKTYGIENGDNLLRQVSMFLDSLKVRKNVFRLGSDQFCVIIEKDCKDTYKWAQVIEERFKHPWFSDSQVSIMMSASICCAECPRDAKSYGELIEVNDYSMSVAKKTNKGKITLVEDIDLTKIKMDKAVEKAVKLAMDRDELMVHYQPIFCVEKGTYNSAEALVRLHNKDLGWISPELFIPIAEKNGLIVAMGDMILEKVCRFIRDFRIRESTVEYIEINISPIQLMQTDFVDRVKTIMDKYGVTPDLINMEITETATVGSSEVIGENIEKLVQLGIRFSLDDYGSGHANIDYINHMPFSIIKLDKTIIWDAFQDEKAGIALKYTIDMLNALKLHVVAEGVETEEMRDTLVGNGCHFMQGWLYSKAVAEDEFVKLIDKIA